MEATASREVRSFCRYCEALCGVLVTVEGDRVVSVRGDADHPISRGYTCPKGRSLPLHHHSPGRLDVPRAAHQDAAMTSGWDAVLMDLAQRLRLIVDEHGPDAVGIFLGTGSSFDPAGRRAARQLMRALGSRSVYSSTTVDTPCKPLVAESMAGQPMLMPLVDEERPGLTILIGTNPVVSHGHLNAFANPRTRLRRLATEGELWVIDPRRTETAALATRHLQPRPASDHAWLAWLAGELLASADSSLEERAVRIDELRDAVAPYDLARACSETGLAEQDLVDLRDAIRRWGGLAGQTGTGCTMAPNANLTEWLLWVVHVLTDSFDRPGTTWFNPGLICGFDSTGRQPTDAIARPGPSSRPELPRRWGEYPCAALADEIDAGNLRALLVVGGNPTLALPSAERLADSLQNLEVLAVADTHETPTTELASHVLPVAGQLERADIPHFIDQLQPAVVAQHTSAVVPLGADRRPMWWVFTRIAQLLGLDIAPGIDVTTGTDDDMLALLMADARVDLATLADHDGPLVADGPVFGWSKELLRGGRWDLAPVPLVSQLRDHRPTVGLMLVSQRQLRHLNSQLADSGTADGRRDAPSIEIHPEDAATYGLGDGDEASVISESGSLHGRIRLDPGLLRGTISVPHGFSVPNINALTSDRSQVDPLTGMVTLSGLMVQLRAAEPVGGPDEPRL